MTTSERKRALPAKVAAMKARKRQKLAETSADNKKGTSKKANSSRKVDLNALAWKDVSLPDRLEDYEGFFGLEEIDDVEIKKDDATGQLSYFAIADEETTDKTPSNAGNTRSDGEKLDDTWSGFDDDDVNNKPAQQPVAKSKKIATAKKQRRSETAAKKQQTNGTNAKQYNVDAKSSASTGFIGLDQDPTEDECDISAWKDLRLSPDTLASLSKMKFTKPTKIQQAVIPVALEGHDVIGKASTGSGKTLAFGIPIFERFLESRIGDENAESKHEFPLALILSPTRELAHQLSQHLNALSIGLLSRKPLIATLTGGLSLQKQQRLLKDADIIIGTPGRLWEIISSGQGVGGALKKVEFLVVDEADRLLSEGHFKEVEEILNTLDREDQNSDDESDTEVVPSTQNLPKSQRQTLVFSATFNRDLQRKLSGKSKHSSNILNAKESVEYLLSKLNFREEQPRFIDANPVSQLAPGLKEGLVECGATEKDLYLYALLLIHLNTRTMVFTNSISAVRRLIPFLQNLNLPIVALHSGMPQKARLRAIERFNQPPGSDKTSASILIATDVAARGLDIPKVQLVVHYHLPRAADTYVHRSGRTARAGNQGFSILICSPEEVAGVRRLVAKVHAQSAVARTGTGASDAARQGYYIRTLDIDRRVVARLKERARLAKTLADSTVAKEKQHKEDDFMRAAAEELGVEYDSEEFERQANGKRGRGGGRMKKEREARGMSRADLAALRAELKSLLKQRVNVGVSERYLASGSVDVDELLRQQDAGNGKTGEFLGDVGGLGLEDF